MKKIALALLLVAPSVWAETESTESFRNMSLTYQSLSSTNTFTFESDSGSADVDDDSTAYALRLSWYSKDDTFCETCERVYFVASSGIECTSWNSFLQGLTEFKFAAQSCKQ